MGLHSTTANQVKSECLTKAREGVKSLQDWLRETDEAMERSITLKENEGFAFPIDWCSEMMNKALTIYNEVARCNGAVLVRNIEKVDAGVGGEKS